MDFAEASDQVGSADIVILNRVLCCYPDMPRLAGASADHARRLLVMSYPRQTWWLRMVLPIGNGLLRLMRREFHFFLHPPQQIIATSEHHGLVPVLDQKGVMWTVAALSRVA
jgi:magnesium-protoporphyrin O-methyltransferase